jgi:hypothetical protein
VLQLPSTVRIDIPLMSPRHAMLKVWEELVNELRKDGADPVAAFVHSKKVQNATGASMMTSGGHPRGRCLDDDQWWPAMRPMPRRRPAAAVASDTLMTAGSDLGLTGLDLGSRFF